MSPEMVKNRIKTFARLKRDTKLRKPLSYDIAPLQEGDVLTIYKEPNVKGTPAHKFRFDKVFDIPSKQNELFDYIAKPIINGVLNGFNGTIFAYGPTGSGKTYSLTGSHTKYNNRGLIPRSIEYIFNFTTKSFDSYVINISYLEIYNEIAYDLLNSKENVSTLEELPRVLLLEDNKGQAHFKNLSVPRVCSEEEAMRLLFLGDTNRTIAETPLNEYSSRSHCIFTLHVTARVQDTGKIIKSKLNLVDLAGSERVHKMNLNGITLSEAKYINLSLHYLEQVILAISEAKRVHIPFRNSMMTLVLRDSISGNCLTAMLATIAVTKFNFEETITTCKFAQRVSLVKTEVKINEETDPQTEIALLRDEIAKLRQLLAQKEGDTQEKLDKIEKEQCQESIKKYLYNNQEEDLTLNDSRKVKFYIEFLKSEIKRKVADKSINPKTPSDIEIKYKQIIKQKDEEISILMNIFNNKLEEEKLRAPINSEIFNSQIQSADKTAFAEFMSKSEYKNTLDFYANTLEEKHNIASNIATSITEEQSKITSIRKDIDNNCNNFESLEQLSFRLKSEQNVYRELLLKLQNIKSEIEYLKRGLLQFQTKLIEDFKKWVTAKKNISDKNEDRYYAPRKCCSQRISSDLLERYSSTELSIRHCKSERFDIHAELDVLFERSSIKKSFDSPTQERKVPDSTKLQYPVRDTNYSKKRFEATEDIENIQPVRDDQVTTVKSTYTRPTLSAAFQVVTIGALDEKPVRERPSDSKTSVLTEASQIIDIRDDLFNTEDSDEFRDFMKTIPLTGDKDVDEEIVKFYRIKFK